MTDDDRNPNDPNAEAFDAPVEPPPPSHQPATEPPRTGPAAPPDAQVDSKDEPIDVEPEARTVPWLWIGGIILALFVLYLIWR